MRSIGIVTTNRADYGSFVPILEKMRERGGFNARLFAAGAHVPAEDEWPIAERIDLPVCGDSAEAIAHAMGCATVDFAAAFQRWRPDLLLALGDRVEMHSAVVAAVPFLIPVAHIHGGELTEGAIDDALRHSITKLSHLHFAATDEYRDRIVQMGEEPWRVVVSGAPAIDALLQTGFPPSDEFRGRLLVTFHPETLAPEQAEWQVEELLAAVESCGLPVLFTGTNSDTASQVIAARIRRYCDCHENAMLISNLGSRAYFSAMRVCACMAGNSSSALIEAPSFCTPAVNVGRRQDGRIRARNTIDCEGDRESIAAALKTALTPKFRASLANLVNPYGNGKAAETIVERLATVALGDGLIRKRFYRP